MLKRLTSNQNTASRQTSLQNRLLTGMGVMLVPLMALSVGAFVSIESAVKAFENTAQEVEKEIFPLTRLQKLIESASKPAEEYIVNAEPTQLGCFIYLSHQVDNTFKKNIFPFDKPQERALFLAAQNEWQQARMTSEAIFTSHPPVEAQSAVQEMERLDKKLDEHTDRAINLISQIYDVAHFEIKEDLLQAYAIKKRGLLLIATVCGLGLLTVLVGSIVLARSILVPVGILTRGVSRFGEGELDHRIVLNTGDELEELAKTFNLMASKLEQSQADLKDLASRDGLTSVYNRREFEHLLKAEVERTRRYIRPSSLLMVDIDHFKNLNDTYGHQAGDEALRATAALIKQEVRPTDQVARYGGEEFAIILPETSGESAFILASRLRKIIANQVITVTQGQSFSVTVSIGAATFPQDAWSEDTLIFAADQALYAAKHAGRDRVCQFVRQAMVQKLTVMQAPKPSNEVARLNALYRYNILDTPPDAALDNITSLAAQICQTPTALISLLDSNRQWFKSRVGSEIKQTGRDVSFCAHAILQSDVLIVQDTFQDSRFANNPLVITDPKIRFYAAAPLITPEGYAIGTLCVIDYVPRELHSQQVQILQDLANQVIAQLELQRELVEL